MACVYSFLCLLTMVLHPVTGHIDHVDVVEKVTMMVGRAIMDRE